jgi:hypothetical protein
MYSPPSHPGKHSRVSSNAMLGIVARQLERNRRATRVARDVGGLVAETIEQCRRSAA